MKRLIVVGAGPAGLATAALARLRGHDVAVLEAAEVGASLRRWGSTRLFTPFAMNLPAAVREVLGPDAPADDRLLSAPEMIERVLEPLARHPLLEGAVRPGHRVVAIGRAGLTRLDFAGHPLRAERPFRVVAATPDGERTFEADGVLDASGCGAPARFGPGGLPAAGEGKIGPEVIRHLGDLEAALPALAGRRVLLLGHGHSAATAILRLKELAESAPGTRVVWAFRTGNRRPCTEVAGDPLPERQRVASGANDLALDPPRWLEVERRANLEAIERDGSGVRAVLTGSRAVPVDAAAAFTGYRPDPSFLSELTVELAPATEGTAGIARALAGATDCLTLPAVSPADLETGEPGFYFIGARSYGRSRNFLLRTGFAHAETILERLATVLAA